MPSISIRGHRELFAQLVAILHGNTEQAETLRAEYSELADFIEEKVNYVTTRLEAEAEAEASATTSTETLAHPGADKRAGETRPSDSAQKSEGLSLPVVPSTVAPVGVAIVAGFFLGGLLAGIASLIFYSLTLQQQGKEKNRYSQAASIPKAGD